MYYDSRYYLHLAVILYWFGFLVYNCNVISKTDFPFETARVSPDTLWPHQSSDKQKYAGQIKEVRSNNEMYITCVSLGRYSKYIFTD